MELAEARAAAQAELDSFSSPDNPLRLVDDADVADVGWGWVWAWSTARWFETRDPADAPPPGDGPVVVVKETGETFHLGSTPAFDQQLAEYAEGQRPAAAAPARLVARSGHATRPPGAVSRAASAVAIWRAGLSPRPSRPRPRPRGSSSRTPERGGRRTPGHRRRAGPRGSWPGHGSGRSGLPRTAAQGRSWASRSASRRSLRVVGHAGATTYVPASFPVQPRANTREVSQPPGEPPVAPPRTARTDQRPRTRG